MKTTNQEAASTGRPQYRFADKPLAHQLFMTYRVTFREHGVDLTDDGLEALADIAEGTANLLANQGESNE